MLSDERLRVYLPLMINQQEKLRDVAWSELFRWLLLLRSVRIALMARVLILGAIGLIVTTLGWRAINCGLLGTAATRSWRQWRDGCALLVVDKDRTPELSIDTSVHSADELFAQVGSRLAGSPGEPMAVPVPRRSSICSTAS